MAIILQLVML